MYHFRLEILVRVGMPVVLTLPMWLCVGKWDTTLISHGCWVSWIPQRVGGPMKLSPHLWSCPTCLQMWGQAIMQFCVWTWSFFLFGIARSQHASHLAMFWNNSKHGWLGCCSWLAMQCNLGLCNFVKLKYLIMHRRWNMYCCVELIHVHTWNLKFKI